MDRAMPIASRSCELGFDVCRCSSGAPADDVRWLGRGFAVGRSGDGGLVYEAVSWPGHADDWKEIQGC